MATEIPATLPWLTAVALKDQPISTTHIVFAWPTTVPATGPATAMTLNCERLSSVAQMPDYEC